MPQTLPLPSCLINSWLWSLFFCFHIFAQFLSMYLFALFNVLDFTPQSFPHTCSIILVVQTEGVQSSSNDSTACFCICVYNDFFHNLRSLQYILATAYTLAVHTTHIHFTVWFLCFYRCILHFYLSCLYFERIYRVALVFALYKIMQCTVAGERHQFCCTIPRNGNKEYSLLFYSIDYWNAKTDAQHKRAPSS